MEAEDTDASLKRLANSIRERFILKKTKGYSSDTVLVIAFELTKLRGRKAWEDLYAALDAVGGIESEIFASVYFFNFWSNDIQQVF